MDNKQIPKQEIFLAAEHGNVKGLTILEKDFGVESIKIQDDEGFTLMSYASANGHESVIRYLIQKGLDCNIANMYGWTPLMQAAYYGWLPAVGRLLEGGAKVNDVNIMGTTALLCACKSGYYSIAEMLIKQGAEVNISESKGYDFTPLMAACQSGNDQMVRLLLMHGAKPNVKQKVTEWTALMLASLNNHKEVVKILLANGADKESVNTTGKTAIEICCEVGNDEIATLLHGGKPYKPADKKRMPGAFAAKKGVKVDLFEASKQGNVLAVNELIAANKEVVHVVDKDGATPLMFAAMRGHVEVCRALIDSGSSVDAQDYRSGWSAFMQAVHHRQREVAELLIEYDANVNLRATNGCGAFDVATFNGDTEMIQLIASTSMGKKGNRGKEKSSGGGKQSLKEKRARLKSAKTIEDEDDIVFESAGKKRESTGAVLKKHQSDLDMFQSHSRVPKHSSSMEVDESLKSQIVPAPPDFSVSPSANVLLDRVRKALNTEIQPIISETDAPVQRFPSSRQQSKSHIEKTESDRAPKDRGADLTNHVTPSVVDMSNWSPQNRKKDVVHKPVVTETGSSPLARKKEAPLLIPPSAPKSSMIESDWSPRTNIPNRVPGGSAVDYPRKATTPASTNSFQKFLMKKTSAGGIEVPDHGRKVQDWIDSPPKPARGSPMVAGPAAGDGNRKKPKELPPSVLNLISRNIPKSSRGKPSRQQYGNIASSGDLLANLAVRYGKPGGGAVRVPDIMPVKQPTRPAPNPTINSSLPDILRQFSLDKYIPIFEEHEIDVPCFLSMTNSDLEEIGILAAEEKLAILDAIAEVQDMNN